MRFRIADQRVKKETGALVGVLQFPGLAAVGSFVDPRLIAIAARHDIRGIRAERVDIAKIEIAPAGHAQLLPRCPLIGRAQNYSVRTGDPNHIIMLLRGLKANADAAQVGVHAAGLDFPPGSVVSKGKSKQSDDQHAHDGL